jgi:hypothetical protein
MSEIVDRTLLPLGTKPVEDLYETIQVMLDEVYVIGGAKEQR